MSLFKDDFSIKALTCIPSLVLDRATIDCVLCREEIGDSGISNLIQDGIIVTGKDDEKLRGYAYLFSELNKELPAGVNLFIMPNSPQFKLLLLDKNHSDIIAGLNDLVKKTGYGLTSEYAYSSGFVFYKQGIGVLMEYDDYSLSVNNAYSLRKRLNNEFEKMEILVRIYNYKVR
ncbi:MAG TPA: hypothetical protein VI790_03140 [Candidatus Nanoarchaeia archaeon]|nr:hypothetical protein [Candidatus Nanoarchaeia archaeon]